MKSVDEHLDTDTINMFMLCYVMLHPKTTSFKSLSQMSAYKIHFTWKWLSTRTANHHEERKMIYREWEETKITSQPGDKLDTLAKRTCSFLTLIIMLSMALSVWFFMQTARPILGEKMYNWDTAVASIHLFLTIWSCNRCKNDC